MPASLFAGADGGERNMEERDSRKENAHSRDARRETIRRLVGSERIATQMELTRRLQAEGFPVTQATVSRDIRELRLVKIADGGGLFHYEMSKPAEQFHASGKFYTMFQSSVTGVDYANNLVVIHTYTGMAQAVCATMDGMEWPGVLGTVAGDDTVLVIAKTDQDAAELTDALKGLMSGY